MLATSVFNQNDGKVTQAYYASMNAKGYYGQLAVALFRAQKRSTAAKKYRGRKYKSATYDVKNWSLSEIVRVLQSWQGFGYTWGWRYDAKAVNFEWVLYVDLPTGQASFHSAARLAGPDYKLPWRPVPNSEKAILDFCDTVWDPDYKPSPAEQIEVRQEAAEQMGFDIVF